MAVLPKAHTKCEQRLESLGVYLSLFLEKEQYHYENSTKYF